MAPEEYVGPLSLRASKYAAADTPLRKPNTSFPSLVLHARPTNSTIATKEQIQAAGMESHNPDAQLAIAQNENLREQVQKHSTEFTRSVSSAVTNTRQLISRLREALMKDGNPSEADLKAVDALWDELERLFEVAKHAKIALPKFLEKQEENMRLYHRAMMNEMMQDTQQELNLQHKKVDIQHSLILDHQQTFKEYKEQTESKLKAINELQERVSRLTLEGGLLKTELDNCQTLLKQANATNTEATSKLQNDLQAAEASKVKLERENEELRNAVTKLQVDLEATELQVAERYEQQLHQKDEALSKAVAEKEDLEKRNKGLQDSEMRARNYARKEFEQLKAETEILREKYNNQVAEYSKLFSETSENPKKVSKLTEELDALRKQNAELMAWVSKFGDLKKDLASLSDSKAALEKKVESLQQDAQEAHRQLNSSKKEFEAKSKKLEKENEDLEIEHNDTLAELARYKKSALELATVREENEKLRASVLELRNKPEGGSGDPAVASLLEKELQAAQEVHKDLEGQRDEWRELAKRTYNEYSALQKKYKEAKFGAVGTAKDEEIKKLKSELEAVKASKAANGLGGGADVSYWKGKYETLLANISRK